MRGLLIMALIVGCVSLFASCGPSGLKPGEIVEQYQNALNAGDYDKAATFVTDAMRKTVLDTLKASLANFDNQQRDALEKVKAYKITILKTDITNDKAKVTYTNGGFQGANFLGIHDGKWVIEQ